MEPLGSVRTPPTRNQGSDVRSDEGFVDEEVARILVTLLDLGVSKELEVSRV